MHPLKVGKWVVSGLFTRLCSSHRYLIAEHFSLPQMKSCTHQLYLTIPPAPRPWQH